jgi:uncharacterized protein (DUF4415 family)
MRKKSTVTFDLDAEKAPTAAEKARIEALASLADETIDTSDIPPLSDAFWRRAARNPFYRPVKRQLTVRVDADVLAWLRSQGPGYQTKLNAILREAMVKGVTKR